MYISREDVHIDGIGLIVVLIVPVAYVHLNTQQYDSLPPKRQLLITCAGVWHNVVLTVAAILLLILLPVLLYPFFDVGTGVTVRNIQQVQVKSKITGIKVTCHWHNQF
jgi:S2P endopeptidase